METFRTFHNHLHIIDKTMDYTQGLRSSHPSLLLGQSVQPLDGCFDLTVTQQLLRKLLCGTLSHGQFIRDGVGLTAPSLFYLLGS
jgi:hypothetical protein